jgi:methionyl-tRNA formyltransferase
MRVVFMGTPEFALPSLRALIQSSYEVCAVITQPDRPAGRGHRLQPPPVKIFAQECGIRVYQAEKIRAEENRSFIQESKPDFLVVVAYGQILPGWLLQSPAIAPVNLHGSLLPRYRGAAPAAWAIMNGDPVTGVTTMLIEERMDTGPILLKREVPIPFSMTRGELEQVLSGIGAELLIPTLDGLARRSLQPVPQDDSQASMAPKITREMARVCWNNDAVKVHNFIRALNPWPLARSEFQSQSLHILRAAPDSIDTTSTQAAPGVFLGVTQSGIRVQCGGGSVLELLEVQLAGRNRISGRDFASGARLRPGESLSSLARDA